ncbi:unnamed protein product, partial [Oppiella nova]
GHNHSPNAFPQQTNIPPQPSSTRASGHNSPTNRHKTGSSGEPTVKPLAANPTATTTATNSHSQTNSKGVSERVVRANIRISDNPYDIEAWNVLIKDAQSKRIDESRDFFERLVSQFPNSGRFWKLFIETE